MPPARPNRPARALPAVALLALAWGALADIPTQFDLGPLSVSGAATLLAGLLSLALFPMLLAAGRVRSPEQPAQSRLITPGPRRGVVPLALATFVAVALLGLVRNPSVEGVQEVCVYLSFAVLLGFTAVLSTEQSARRFLDLMAVVMAVVGALGIVWFGFFYTDGTSVPLWGERPYALVAMTAVAALAPVRFTNPIARAAPFLLVVAVAASLSRTALVISILALAFVLLRSRRGFRGLRITIAFVALIAVTVAAFLLVPSLRDRFLAGDNAVDIGGVSLNTSGRSQVWALVFQDGLTAPWFGHGAGHAGALVSAKFPFIAHPHNEYLRFFDDFGLLGLVLFLVGYGALVVGAVRRALAADRDAAGLHWGAALALLAVGVAAFTDNAFVYPFVMLPLAVVVGLSIGRREVDRRPPATAAVRRALAGRSA